jgi:hypothetical protein
VVSFVLLYCIRYVSYIVVLYNIEGESVKNSKTIDQDIDLILELNKSLYIYALKIGKKIFYICTHCE